MQYGGEPISWFQKKIRGNTIALNDHISKEMNELNLIRCQRIPKRPGCDWHDLPDEKVNAIYLAVAFTSFCALPYIPCISGMLTVMSVCR